MRAAIAEPNRRGDVVVSSGKIVACDPLAYPDQDAFELKTPSGRFPVDLRIVHYANSDQRIAAAVLRFAEGTPTFWDLAATPAKDTSTLAEGEFFGYAVDSGTGAFMDLEAAERLRFRMSEDESYFEKIIDRMRQNYVHTRDWTIFEIDEHQTLNFAAFSSGYGDGLYPSYWGWSPNGLICLATDFGLLPSSVDS